MGLGFLVLGLVVLLGTHVFTSLRERRSAVIARLGTAGYRAIYSLISTIGLVLVVWGYARYRAHEWVDVWTPPDAMRHVTVGLMLIASILFVAGLMPSRIKAKTKHPMLASVKTWAFAHLLSNGDLGAILLFGGFLAWAVYARIAAKRRTDEVLPAAPAGWTNDIVVVVAGIALYLALGYLFHPYVIGISVFGR